MKALLRVALAIIVACCASAATRNKHDACEIAALPAATLLLPYFEVDLEDSNGETTLLTITNVSNVDAIARVTLWTDRAYPVISFNVFLTGYDVQELNLFDIIERGIIAPDAGTGTAIARRGDFSRSNTALELGACDRLAGPLDDAYVVRMQSAFTEGTFPMLGTFPACSEIGNEHDYATGYATIDVVGACTSGQPGDASYWTSDLRHDNVLIGDYQQVNHNRNFGQGGALVSIRAVPEDEQLERTFYARYQSPATPNHDRRQPLPSQFATRWIQGGPDAFETSLKIWREGRDERDVACAGYANENDLVVREIVVFDEQENAVGSGTRASLPTTSHTGVDDADVFPQLANGATSGWMYLNLDRSGRDDIASQAWVISSMRAAARYSTDIDAIAMGDGCSAPAEKSEISLAHDGAPIAPVASASINSCDIALLPAATLLLPYFEVQFAPPPPPPPDQPPPPPPPRDPTLFTITNVSPHDQIARVTLWTDYGFPVLTFNVFLTGYDVQSINVEDIIRHGIIAPKNGTGTSGTRRGDWSHRNKTIDTTACGRLLGQLSGAEVERIQRAFIDGEAADASDPALCDGFIGDSHENAVGYATIDLVRNCETNGPFSDEYWTEDLAFDNVLIGDSQQVDPYNGAAGGAPLVHIRAMPDAQFPRTFYSRYQTAAAPQLDARQPLPHIFAVPWRVYLGEAYLKIWREGRPGRTISCTNRHGPLELAEAVLFDQAENAFTFPAPSRIGNPLPRSSVLPATSRRPLDSREFPRVNNGAMSGWLYLNLDNAVPDDVASSNWVVTSFLAPGRYAIDIDAPALGNGCTAPAPESEINNGTAVIGPRP